MLHRLTFNGIHRFGPVPSHLALHFKVVGRVEMERTAQLAYFDLERVLVTFRLLAL